ncbi:MAG: hypothetical protein HQL26_08895 [Candidatus Omnitrophica bacterium]|nr:hypothetical protein [Candidatus Omnitrophota bacterium]
MYKCSLILLLILFFSMTIQAWARVDVPEGWSVERTRHFLVYYKNVPYDLVKTVQESAEECFRTIKENLGMSSEVPWTLDDRAKIYIYPNHDDYVAALKGFPWSSGVAHAKDKTIRTFPAENGFFDSVLPHELGHIIFREVIGFETEIPLWLEEGVAMNQEKAKRYGSDQYVKEAIKNKRFKTLAQLSQMQLTHEISKTEVDLFYEESASAVNFLINEYEDVRFFRLCKKLKEGFSFEPVLEKVYPQVRSIKRLNDNWVDYLERK